MSTIAERYARRGLLAIQPMALGELFAAHQGVTEPPPADGIAVVNVCGPLECEPSGWWDSYPEILRRVECAMTAPGVDAVVLRVSSPGGDAHGCFDTARAIRALSLQHGVPVYAYVEERACSAAYALACAAAQIFVSESSLLGSIGVLYVRDDVSARNTAMGLRVEFIASGERKADGNPDSPVTEAELGAQQALVDQMAVLFFGLVRELRGVDPQPLNAGVFLGAGAVAKGLADRVVSLTGLRALITSGALRMSAYEKARKALEEAAAEDSPEGEKAKRALAAMDDDEKPDAEGDEEKPDAEGDEPKPDAEGDEPKPDAEGDEPTEKKDKGEPPAAATSSDSGAQALVEVKKLRAQLARDRDLQARSAIFATRPDWTPEFRKTLATMPTAALKLAAKTWAKQATTVTAKAALAAAGARPTMGQGTVQSQGVNSLSARMGLVKAGTAVVSSDYKLQLGVAVPVTEINTND